MLTGPDKGLAAMPSAKTRGGLGLIPRRLQSCGELWRRPLRPEEAEMRISGDHRPFHDAIAAVLRKMRDRFGFAILLDVHSMPPILPRHLPDEVPPQLVVGDRFGRSAASLHSELVLALLQRRGYAAALNSPYSGDYILHRHGQPHANIHALQLEIDRSLYLDSDLREPSGALAAMAQLVQDVAAMLADQAIGECYAQAAE
jgi:N-formylglutamate amidohydrolase